MENVSDKLVRDNRTGALVSTDVQGLATRRQQLADRRRIQSLEQGHKSLEMKLDAILELLRGRDG